jgi:predicted dehydrogenase
VLFTCLSLSFVRPDVCVVCERAAHGEHRPIPCLQVQGERGSLLLKDFCQLKRTAPVEEWLLRDGSYGRRESVDTLVEAIQSGGWADIQSGGPRGGAGNSGRLITARQGRNAQRLLDAILASNGEWVTVSYD